MRVINIHESLSLLKVKGSCNISPVSPIPIKVLLGTLKIIYIVMVLTTLNFMLFLAHGIETDERQNAVYTMGK